MQNYPYRQNYTQPYNQGFKVIPIANESELNNITVDYMGVPSYFHNQSTNEIFIKQFDIRTGITNLQKFIKSDGAGHEISHAKEQESIDLYKEQINSINDRIDGLKEIIEKMKEDKKK